MFLLFLFLFCNLCANESLIPTLENDPCVLIEGKVNALTGKLALFEEDLVIQGAQPIRISRSYVAGKKGAWSIYETLATMEQRSEGYRWVFWEHGCPIIYKEAGKQKIGNEKFYRFVSSNLNEGFSNTFRGEISSRTNLKNNYFLADKDFKFITVHSADGTIRRYKKSGHKTGEGQTIYRYRLLSEQLPNGNWILYEYGLIKKTKNKEWYYLKSIQTTNPSKTKIYATAHFYYEDRKQENKSFTIRGSDGQEVTYRYRKNKKKRYFLAHIFSSVDQDQFFEVLDHSIGYEQFRKQLTSISFPLDRREEYAYYLGDEVVMGQSIMMNDQLISTWDEDNRKTKIECIPDWRKGLIKTLSSRIGTDVQMKVTHSFIYNKGKTSVYDCDENRTDFSFDDTWHLQKIERFSKTGQLLNGEQFVWGRGQDVCNLVVRSFFDAHSTSIFAKRLFYDRRGNVIKAKIYGNLSGICGFVCLDAQGFPIENSTETYTKHFHYSSSEPNLLLEAWEDNGKRVVYEYLPGSDLLTSQVIYNRSLLNERITLTYNEDRILIREVHDDGVSHTICEFGLVSSGPYFNMPEYIRKKYWDGNREIPLKTEKLTYTTGGRIAQKDVYDANGTLRYSLNNRYDEKGRLIARTNALGFEEHFSYDLCGNQIQHREPFDRMITTTDFDYSNRPCTVRKTGEGISLESRSNYDMRHRLISETDCRGALTTYTYDSLDRCISTLLPPLTTEQGAQTPIIYSNYDCIGNEIERRDAEKNITKTTYNAYGKPICITHPDEAQEKHSYWLDGSLYSHTDARRVTTFYTWDVLGHLLTKKKSSAEEAFFYQGNHLVAKTDAEGNRTTYSYDGAGRLISEEFDGLRTTYTYDSLGRVSIVEKGPLRTVFEYDLLDRVLEERKIDISSGELLRWVRTLYDAAGNPNELISFSGEQESREQRRYDALNRLVWKKYPLGAVETIFYEDRLGKKTHIDPMGLVTIETFDAHHHPITVERKQGTKTLTLEEKSYTLTGLLSLQRDTIFSPDGSSRRVQTHWKYDPRGRVIELIEADGSIDAKRTQTKYTPSGERASTIKPDGTILSYEYDDLGHLRCLTSSDSTVSYNLTYNQLGHLVQSNEIFKDVNARGQIIRENFRGLIIEQQRDALGRKVVSLIPQANCRIEREYNACDLTCVTRKTFDGQILYAHKNLVYDLSGNLLKEQLGTLEKKHSSFDLCRRKEKIVTPSFSQEVMEFDCVGNIRRMRGGGEESIYTYDELYQLTSESGPFVHNYRYDSLYNRLQKDGESYSVNDLQQLISHWKYDTNGNPIAKSSARHTYDALDRLIRLETPEYLQTFTYDFENRCLSKTTFRDGKQRTFYFLYDGNNEIGAFNEHQQIEELRVLGETPHAERGSAVAIELQGTVYVPIHDLQGNVVQLLDLQGNQVSTYRYSAFGEEQCIGAVKSPWRFSSKRTDEWTGLVFFGRRWYNPEEGRWLTSDPAGFTDGMNLYAFVHNDPLTHFDEYGLVTHHYRQGWVSTPWVSAPWVSRPWVSHPNTYESSRWQAPPSSVGIGSRITTPPVSDPYPHGAPHYYVNGMWNTRADNHRGAATLLTTYERNSNIIPFYSESFGKCKDLRSVWRSKVDPNYSSFAINRLNRTLHLDCTMLSIMEDPRKVFVTCFSRGSTDTFHATKDFSLEMKNQLIITACGPIMILPKDLGFSVLNLVSEGDRWSFACNYGLRENQAAYDDFANVRVLEQKDKLNWLTGDHFFESKTYQEGIKEFAVPRYAKFGQLK